MVKNYNSVYTMTNENVSCLKELCDMDNAKVLTVLGSGDQYFTSLLYGAKEVSVFDINDTAWLYFRIKFKALRVLSYEEFMTLFIKRRFKDVDIFNKLYYKLSYRELKYYCYIAENYEEFMLGNDIFHPNTIIHNEMMRNNMDKFVPYLDRDKYYQLQEIVNRIELPSFYHNDFMRMKAREGYDILHLSNIYDYMLIGVGEFKEIIESYGASYVLARYSWYYDDDVVKFLSNGFCVDRVYGDHFVVSYKGDYVRSRNFTKK